MGGAAVSRRVSVSEDMEKLHSERLFRLTGMVVIACLCIVFPFISNAGKIYTAHYGRVYLNSGDTIVADGNLRIRVPMKKKPVEIIEDAYTRNNKLTEKIDPQVVDSVVIWTVSAPEYPHAFRFIKEYGWCFEAEHTPYISVCCYSPKGYYCGGNGGLWMRGKSTMLVIKDNQIYNFGQPEKQSDKKMRLRLESLVADDPRYVELLRTIKGRRDKVLRSLRLYKSTLNQK